MYVPSWNSPTFLYSSCSWFLPASPHIYVRISFAVLFAWSLISTVLSLFLLFFIIVRTSSYHVKCCTNKPNSLTQTITEARCFLWVIIRAGQKKVPCDGLWSRFESSSENCSKYSLHFLEATVGVTRYRPNRKSQRTSTAWTRIHLLPIKHN